MTQKRRSRDRSGRGLREPLVTDATRQDVLALIERFNVPMERGAVAGWHAFARALAYEARRHRLSLPFWLARFAGYPEPPVPLRVLPGGAAGSEDRTTHVRRSRFEDRPADPWLHLVQDRRSR